MRGFNFTLWAHAEGKSHTCNVAICTYMLYSQVQSSQEKFNETLKQTQKFHHHKFKPFETRGMIVEFSNEEL